MTIEQTVDIPTDRRIFLDLPQSLAPGKARVEVRVTPVTEAPWLSVDRFLEMKHADAALENALDECECREHEEYRKRGASPSLMDLYGSCKGEDTLDAYFARKRADKAHEEERVTLRFKETDE